MTRQYRVAIVEDHVLQRARTEELINGDEAFRTVYSGESMPAFITWLRAAPSGERPDLLVLDLMIERKPSVDVAMVRRMLEGGLRIVVLSAMASPPLVRSIVAAGVTAVVGKRDAEEDILAAIHAALRGEGWVSPELAAILAGDANRPRLSVQEEQTLILYASGLTIGQVAEALNIGTETARQYLSRVRRKYVETGVAASTKLDLVKIAWRDGYVDPLA